AEIGPEEEQRLELALVPHDRLARGRAEEGQEDQVAVPGVAEALAPWGGRRLALLLEPGEKRRFLQPEPDEQGEDDEDRRQQEWDPPAIAREVVGRHGGPEEVDDGEGQEEAQRCRGLDPAGIAAAGAVRAVLGDV